MSLKRPSVSGEGWEDGGGGGTAEDRKVPKLKVKLSSVTGSGGDAGSSEEIKNERRLSRTSKTSEDTDDR